jgi:hypothetical protein
MRLFKTSQPESSEEDEIAAIRLMAIASRSKAGVSADSGLYAPARVADAPDVPETPQ